MEGESLLYGVFFLFVHGKSVLLFGSGVESGAFFEKMRKVIFFSMKVFFL